MLSGRFGLVGVEGFGGVRGAGGGGGGGEVHGSQSPIIFMALGLLG